MTAIMIWTSSLQEFVSPLFECCSMTATKRKQGFKAILSDNWNEIKCKQSIKSNKSSIRKKYKLREKL